MRYVRFALPALLALAGLLGTSSHAYAQPVNDDFVNAIVIPEPLPYSNTQSTIGATLETKEPTSSCGVPGASVWYSFTPGAGATLTADTFGSDFDTVLTVYTFNSTTGFTEVACNDDFSGWESQVQFEATTGTTYHFQVGGYGGATGSLTYNLFVGGSILGTVTEEGTGTPIPDICVDVYDTSWNWMGWDNTDAAGEYSIGGLPTGDYKIVFYDCGSGTYLTEWYNDKPDFDSANLVPVSQGSDTGGIDGALAVGGSISGTVTEEGTGTPLSDICVDFYDASCTGVGYGYTDSFGDYTVGGLPSGDYKVRFTDCDFPPTHISEWYSDKPDCDSADLVSVNQGSDTGGIDAALAVGGSISGTVTEESTGTPLPDICVNVYETSWDWPRSGRTDAAGYFSIGGLPTGDYKIWFRDCGFPATHISEWYSDKPDFNSADLVPVSQGSDTGGINAALAIGGSISGTVTEEGTGTPLSDICVDVYDTSWDWMGWGWTDLSGNYTVGGFPSGDYKVQFTDCSFAPTHVSEWYNDKPDFSSADLVAVTAGSHASGIDAALGVGADADSDGVPDSSDNCPAVANAGQENTDGDAWGDACDPDIDNDGFSNADENSIGTDPLVACGAGAWPPNVFEADNAVDFQDLNAIVPFLFLSAAGNERYNLFVDDAIDFQDLNAAVPFLFTSCEPP